FKSLCFSATISSYHFHSKKSIVIISFSNQPKAMKFFVCLGWCLFILILSHHKVNTFHAIPY
ncbi:hypothetical protein, partial [Peribacillus sp. NPDC101480]|uniref:hypothetical protein n=1 Tax=Peribacillus sp. NPDC101480 TaxID=3390620 RepID=UPI003CFEFF7D